MNVHAIYASANPLPGEEIVGMAVGLIFVNDDGAPTPYLVGFRREEFEVIEFQTVAGPTAAYLAPKPSLSKLQNFGALPYSEEAKPFVVECFQHEVERLTAN